MAPAPEMSKTSLILYNTQLVVDDLPCVAEDWAGWNEDIQADFTLEWMALMTNLPYVLDRVVSGRASPDETAAYEKLQADLRAAAPILRKLELHVRPELLQDLAPPAGRRASA
jgi:hypothetical protein